MAKTAGARMRGCRIPASLQREEVRTLGRGLGVPTGETWPTRDHIARGRRDDMIAISRNVGALLWLGPEAMNPLSRAGARHSPLKTQDSAALSGRHASHPTSR